MTRPSDCVTQRLKTRITWQKCSAVPRIGFLNSCFPLLVYPHHTGEPSPRALLEAGLCIQRNSFHFSVGVVANYTDFIHVATCTNLTVVVFTRSPQLHLLELPPVMPHTQCRQDRGLGRTTQCTSGFSLSPRTSTQNHKWKIPGEEKCGF